MNEAAQTLKNVALLSPCHTQNSRPAAAFCGKYDLSASTQKSCAQLWTISAIVLALFLCRVMFSP
jgi:hypothetical protein